MRQRVKRTLVVSAVVLVCVIYLIRESWLVWLGAALVSAEPLAPAQAIICLAGDTAGNRIVRAAELVKLGLAPVVLVSGPAALYGTNEATLAINFAVSKGFPREYFRTLVHEANSTREEAWAVRYYLEKEGLKKVTVVTSDYHSRRAGAIFRSVLKGIDVHVAVSPDRDFQATSWWKTRPARKVLLLEWTKLIADTLGI